MADGLRRIILSVAVLVFAGTVASIAELNGVLVVSAPPRMQVYITRLLNKLRDSGTANEE